MAMDQDRLMELVGRFVGDLGATIGVGSVVVGRQYRAGTRMDCATSPSESIGEAIAAALDQPSRALPVETDGARREASLLAALID
jgi:hypothetical protein